MKDFSYARAEGVEDAVRMMARTPNARFLAGGTNLVDLMRENIEQPEALVDVSTLPLGEIERHADGGLSIGATVRNTALAGHAAVRRDYPFLAQAVLFGASGQIRNMATVGGNLLQRTRCAYFYDLAACCNKREPGSGCDAIGGFNRMHAILGASDRCIAVHPSDLCVALAALDTTVSVMGPDGGRTIPFADLHRLPGETPHVETALAPGELITGIRIAPLGFARNSLYRKVRDRASYAFALVSVAAALDVKDGKVAGVRLALGGVAHKPWRAAEAERILIGGDAGRAQFERAAEAELAQARAFEHNAFKIELARRTIVGALTELAEQGDA